MLTHGGSASNLFLQSRLQWAPTLTSHDPNPPLTINDAPAAISAIVVKMDMIRMRRNA